MSNENDIATAAEELQHLSLFKLQGSSYEQLANALAFQLNEMIRNNFHAVVQLLYRLDVSEKKLQAVLAAKPPNAGLTIAQLIIDRQLEKIESRRKFRSSKDIPEEDKW